MAGIGKKYWAATRVTRYDSHTTKEGGDIMESSA